MRRRYRTRVLVLFSVSVLLIAAVIATAAAADERLPVKTGVPAYDRIPAKESVPEAAAKLAEPTAPATPEKSAPSPAPAAAEKGSPNPATPSQARRVTVTDVTIKGAPDPLTPESMQKVRLHRYQARGPQAPPVRVALLLLPCTGCGTGWLDPLARDLCARGGVEIFTMERRGMMLEDRDEIDRLRRDAKRNAPEVIAYYLGAQGKLDGGRGSSWSRADNQKFPFIVMWGLRLLHDDMRLAVREVKRLTGLPVVVGGFSGGAGQALSFAARKFDDGRAGHEEIAGVVLLDGALKWNTEEEHEKVKAGAERYLAAMDLDKGFWDMRDDQIRAEIAAALALQDPAGRSPLSDGVVRPEISGPGMTNRAFFGWCLDSGRPPERGFLGTLYQIQMGNLAPPSAPGALTDWQDGGTEAEPVRIAQAASVARAPGWIFDWYYPRSLIADEWDLLLKGYSDPDQGISEQEKISVPLFTVVTKSARMFGPDQPPFSGTWLFSRIPAKGSESIDVPEFAHTDILVADAAREKVYAPLHRWLMKIAPSSGAAVAPAR